MTGKKLQLNEDYWKFAESERHFNQIQAGIRNLASGWMLAAFAAIALLLKTDENVTWLVSPALLVGVVSFMATFGLIVLWINDQLVYQRLLDCGFITALKMEYDNPQLPPIRIIMMYAAEGKGMSRWMTYFYTIPMWIFLAITVAATLLWKNIGNKTQGVDSNWSLIVLIVLCASQLFGAIWVQWKKSEVGTRARAKLFGVDNFTAMLEGTDDARALLVEIIKRHKPARAAK